MRENAVDRAWIESMIAFLQSAMPRRNITTTMIYPTLLQPSLTPEESHLVITVLGDRNLRMNNDATQADETSRER